MTTPDVSHAQRAFSPDSTYQALYDLAMWVPADQAIIELGTFYGASAIALGQGAQAGYGAHVYAIDPHDLPGYRTTTGTGPVRNRVDYTRPAIRKAAAASIQAAGLADHVTMIRDFSETAGKTWTGAKVGLLFIDGDHREGAVRRDYTAWEPHLARGAMIAFDDHRPAFPGVINTVARLVGKGIIAEPEIVGSLAITQRTR